MTTKHADNIWKTFWSLIQWVNIKRNRITHALRQLYVNPNCKLQIVLMLGVHKIASLPNQAMSWISLFWFFKKKINSLLWSMAYLHNFVSKCNLLDTFVKNKYISRDLSISSLCRLFFNSFALTVQKFKCTYGFLHTYLYLNSLISHNGTL